jgi:hypothetical protein
MDNLIEETQLLNIPDADFVFPSWGISVSTGLGGVLLGVLVFVFFFLYTHLFHCSLIRHRFLHVTISCSFFPSKWLIRIINWPFIFIIRSVGICIFF